MIKNSVNTLKFQFEQAQKDLEKLTQLKETLFEDPWVFVNQLQEQKIILPQLQQVYKIPMVDTRLLSRKVRESGIGEDRNISEWIVYLDAVQHKASNEFVSEVAKFKDEDVSRSRTPLPETPSGRVGKYHGTHNFGSGTHLLHSKKFRRTPTPWTEEDHLKLIEYLDLYPADKGLSDKKRFEKIGEVLNRTASQIASRVRRMQQTKSEPKLWTDFNSSDEDESKERIISNYVVHNGFNCDSCKVQPIVGKRYHCVDCEQVDLCSSCMLVGFSSGEHSASHRMEVIEVAEKNMYENDDLSYLDGNLNS